jgi:hypothetical protein
MIGILLAALAAGSGHDAAALENELREVTGAHRSIARLVSYGKSRGGRDLWCVELGPVERADKARLPALLVVAGLDGEHLVGTEVVLDHVHRLVEGHGKDDAVTKLLDEHLVYLLPRANPDGAEAFFHPGGALREVRGNLKPVDEDRDGALDEDGPEDLDGDGLITQMRWKDPAGTWAEDPADARALKVADPVKGERGVYKVAVESRDRDGDGEHGEDGPGDVLPSRNFPQRWTEFDPRAGRVPMEEPEALALGQFVIDRPAIALVVVYGLQDNVAVDAKQDQANEQPQSFGSFRFFRSMPGGIVKDDQPLYAELATRYRETTGVTSKPLSEADDGAFWPFAYFQLGLPTLAMHLWSPPLDVKPPGPPEPPKPPEPPPGEEPKKEEPKKEEAPKEEPSAPAAPGADKSKDEGKKKQDGETKNDEVKLLRWNDQKMAGAAFVAWTKVQHPTLGEVEVGGWKPYVRANPPDADVAELAKKHGDFLLQLGGMFARMKIGEPKVEDLGGGLFRVTTAAVNEGYLPSVCGMGERSRRPKPTRLDLDVGAADGPVKLLQGDVRHTWQRIEGSGGRREVKWLLQTTPGANARVTLRLWSERAGDDERVVELR